MKTRVPRSKEAISYNMSRIRGKDTKIERCLAKAMWSSGLRYRKQYPVTGRPDFAFPTMKVAIFCDSEFWHGKGWCDAKKAEFRFNEEFWIHKIERNIQRDREVNDALKSDGWTVIRFWSKDILSNPNACVQAVKDAMAGKITGTVS